MVPAAPRSAGIRLPTGAPPGRSSPGVFQELALDQSFPGRAQGFPPGPSPHRGVGFECKMPSAASFPQTGWREAQARARTERGLPGLRFLAPGTPPSEWSAAWQDGERLEFSKSRPGQTTHQQHKACAEEEDSQAVVL